MNNENKPNNFLKYSYLGFQIVSTVLLGVLVGRWLDRHFESTNSIYTIICSVVMIIVALYQLIVKFLS